MILHSWPIPELIERIIFIKDKKISFENFELVRLHFSNADFIVVIKSFKISAAVW